MQNTSNAGVLRQMDSEPATTTSYRFRFLRRARELGFPLEEVRNLLALAEGDPGSSCTGVDHLARTHLAQVEAKLAQLTALRDELSRVIDQCEGGFAVADCRILGALGASRRSSP